MTTFAASVTIVDLPAASTMTGAELFEAVQTSAGVGQSVQVSLTNMFQAIASASFTWTQTQTFTATVNFSAIFTGDVNLYNGLAPVAGGTTRGIKMGSGPIGVFFGSGAPSLSAGTGSLYLRSDGTNATTRLYVNTNGTAGWTNLTAGA